MKMLFNQENSIKNYEIFSIVNQKAEKFTSILIKRIGIQIAQFNFEMAYKNSGLLYQMYDYIVFYSYIIVIHYGTSV